MGTGLPSFSSGLSLGLLRGDHGSQASCGPGSALSLDLTITMVLLHLNKPAQHSMNFPDRTSLFSGLEHLVGTPSQGLLGSWPSSSLKLVPEHVAYSSSLLTEQVLHSAPESWLGHNYCFDLAQLMLNARPRTPSNWGKPS